MPKSNPVPFPTSIVFRPLSASELDAIRARGRRDDGFDALVQRALRLQVLAGLGRAALDPEARLGIDKAEEEALSRLACRPAADPREWEIKRTVLGPAADRGGNIAGMAAAALASDSARLGLGTRRAGYRGSKQGAAR